MIKPTPSQRARRTRRRHRRRTHGSRHAPTGQFIPAAGMNILPSRVAPAEELDDHDFFLGLSGNPIGSGPWIQARAQPVQSWSNPDYHFGKPKIDRVFVHLISSPDTTQIAMRKGEIDGSRRGGFATVAKCPSRLTRGSWSRPLADATWLLVQFPHRLDPRLAHPPGAHLGETASSS